MNIGHFAGRIGRNAEIRHTPNGKSVANFSLAVDVRKNGQKETLWVACAIWGERGEKLAQYLTKGASVAVSGEIDVRTYDGKEGTKAELSCNVREITLMGGNRDEQRTERAEGRPAPRQQQLPERDPIEDDVPF